jgi:hypothetical protein
MPSLLIDIRQSDEVYSKRFEETDKYKVYTIPMNMIRFSVNMIKQHLEYVDDIYIVCSSGTRSEFIKNKYFKEELKIKVNNNLQFNNLKNGMNQIELNQNEFINVKVVGNGSFNLYNLTRLIQTILGILIIFLGGYTYYQIKNKKVNTIPLIILIVFGVNSLFNGLTSTCTLSMLLKDYLN